MCIRDSSILVLEHSDANSGLRSDWAILCREGTMLDIKGACEKQKVHMIWFVNVYIFKYILVDFESDK